MHSLLRRAPAAIALMLIARASHAQPAAAPVQLDRDKAAAAAAFDEGVRLFRAADYANSAKAFLRADAAIPNVDALKDAMVSARHAGDYVLLAEAAERAELREGDADLARLGREAEVEAAARLARLELSCSIPECVLELDGVQVKKRSVHVLPGTHRLAANATAHASALKTVTCDAGVTYRFDLQPEPLGYDASRITVAPPPRVESSRPLPPAAFYVGVGVTLALTGLTVWSGVDAINGKNNLADPPTTAARDDVLARARRTDVLLGGALLAGALTTGAGIWLVRWSPEHAAASTASVWHLDCRGAALAVSSEL